MTLVLGGARSGKSRYARSLCREAAHVVFVATAKPEGDPEMEARVARHRDERPSHWKTVEAPLELAQAVRTATPFDAVVLVDCITLWLWNLLDLNQSLDAAAREARVLEEVEAFARAARERDVIAVSNEVGSGVVPATPLGREFRDLQGLSNQALARDAGRVILVVAGLPMVVKAEGRE